MVKRFAIIAIGAILSLAVGAGIVRLGLDWSDTFEYSPESELRYLGVAIVAIIVTIAGCVGSVLLARRWPND